MCDVLCVSHGLNSKITAVHGLLHVIQTLFDAIEEHLIKTSLHSNCYDHPIQKVIFQLALHITELTTLAFIHEQQLEEEKNVQIE